VKQFMYNNRKRITVFVLLFVCALAAGVAIGKLSNGDSIENKAAQGQVINILFMGVDARSADEKSRSDTMILASIDTNQNKAVMVWIPRDTRIKLAKGNYEKINAVNVFEGPQAACKTVGELLGTTVDYYAITNFGGFGKIVDILGGVDIDVETKMYHWDPDPDLAINLSKGLQHLNGDDALRYVRYRGGLTADIGRTQRQAKFIKVLGAEMFKTSTILKLHNLVPEIQKHIKTNIPVSDLLYLAKVGKDFNYDDLITQTLPGYGFTDPQTGASYWEINKNVANGIVDKLLAGQIFEIAQDPPDWVRELQNQVVESDLPDFSEGTSDNPDDEDESVLQEDQVQGDQDGDQDDQGDEQDPQNPENSEQNSIPDATMDGGA
jgi:LCP family protein required for cell wall assembly